MAEDKRTSRTPVSDYLNLPNGTEDGGVVLELRDDETLAVDYVRIRYSGNATSETLLTMYDADEFNGGANTTDTWDVFLVGPGDEVIITEATYDDISDGVVVETDGNQDGDITVTVGGIEVTG